MTEQRQQNIVVGVDGSQGSMTAARWALGHAREIGATVELVYTWHMPYLTDATGYSLSVQGSVGQWNDIAVAADSVAGEMVHDLGDLGGVEVTTRALEGPAASTLMQAAKGADLLVVGRRGHGGFLGLHLGSVTTQLAHHYDGVLVIVPEVDEA
jgi:nucleotide-binding universal stress UspA family protein